MDLVVFLFLGGIVCFFVFVGILIGNKTNFETRSHEDTRPYLTGRQMRKANREHEFRSNWNWRPYGKHANKHNSSKKNG